MPAVNFTSILPDSRFLRTMRESYTWQTFTNMLFGLRTWVRRTIWGDRVSAEPSSKEACILIPTAIPTIPRTNNNPPADPGVEAKRGFDVSGCQRNCRRSTRSCTTHDNIGTGREVDENCKPRGFFNACHHQGSSHEYCKYRQQR